MYDIFNLLIETRSMNYNLDLFFIADLFEFFSCDLLLLGVSKRVNKYFYFNASKITPIIGSLEAHVTKYPTAVNTSYF
jgi:hypothetical protein